VRIHDSRLGDFYLPQGVTQQGYDGPTLLSATVWTFGNYDLPDRPDPNLFAIDYHVAETVFDDDIGIFVRQAGGYRAVDSAIAEAQNSPNADADLGHSLDRRHTGAPVIARIAYIGGFTFGAGCLVMVGILIMKRRTGRRI
jgi:hypothetical protein